MGGTLVVIPTYEERDTVQPIVRRVLSATGDDVEVLVVDDASPDGTGDLADELAARHDRVHVLHRTAKAGLGPAYLAGFRWALDAGYRQVVEMDADGSHLPEHLPRLLDELARQDLVIGSRWVPGARVEHWPRRRVLLSRLGNRYARAMLRLPVRDATAGYRAFCAVALRALIADGVASQGYCFQVDLLLRAVDAGMRVSEVPIVFVERTRGRSKMSGRIVLEALLRVTWWGVRRRLPGGRRRGQASRPAPTYEPCAAPGGTA